MEWFGCLQLVLWWAWLFRRWSLGRSRMRPRRRMALAAGGNSRGWGFPLYRRAGARAGMFGLSGEGYKFVYVFDRSGSMGGDGSASLKAVKAELRASLKSLDTVHQFQIVFYNHRPVVFNPGGTPGKLVFGTEQNKAAVERFWILSRPMGGPITRLRCTWPARCGRT